MFRSPFLVASDRDSFRRQESILIALNLLTLIALFSLHLYFASFWGKPAPVLILAVGFGIIAKVMEWLWLRTLTRSLRPAELATLTWASVALNVSLAFVLSILTDKEDTPYFALMVVPVLEAAFRFQLPAIVAVVTVVEVSLFWQVRWSFDRHRPVEVGEYYEAGITSVLFFIVALLAWLLLADLRAIGGTTGKQFARIGASPRAIVARGRARRRGALVERDWARNPKPCGNDRKLDRDR